MSSVKTPQEKKRLSYTKDHTVEGGENDKAFRKKWPIKKAKSNRVLRRKVTQLLQNPDVVEHETADSKTKSVKQAKLQKWGVMPLGESVAKHFQGRIARQGARKARASKRESKA